MAQYLSPHVAHLLHILELLLRDWWHIKGHGPLYHAWVRDHGVEFLRSGWTSASPANHRTAVWLLRLFASRDTNPLDW